MAPRYSYAPAAFLALLALLASGCSSKHYVQVHEDSIALYYTHAGAKEVLFASSIDRYQFHRASETEKDVWEVIVPKEEEFSYFYLVDNTMTLPDCQFTVLDDFGTKNCFFFSEL